jgi:very-short-patch-repair endonuclease
MRRSPASSSTCPASGQRSTAQVAAGAASADWVEVDVLFAPQKVVIEVDGTNWHSTPFRRELDAYKQSLVEAAGHRVVRLIDDDVTPDSETQRMARVWRALG